MKLTLTNPTEHEKKYFNTLRMETEALVDSVIYGKHMDSLISPLRRAIIVIDVLLLSIARIVLIITQQFSKKEPPLSQINSIAGMIKKGLNQVINSQEL